MQQTERMARVLSVVSRAWEPDWAGVMSRRSMDMRKFDGNSPFVDWMVYVPQDVSSPEPPASVTRLPGLGSIVVVQPTPPSPDDPEATTRAKHISDLISLSVRPETC